MKAPDYLRVKVVPSTMQIIVEAVTEELAPVVRCGECKHSIEEKNGKLWCGSRESKERDVQKDFYCANGERG